ncbi:hypothetical protein AGDE_14444 [Angomonas deanei]|uniref:Uncharacterized protein n=1 Tax=Angomonas deanei TaxID=59799 RepID=A0A7G2CSL2_9TRYP|nr:hypothetical protein AGDE_14444 [Angomonas deanei]CAD2221202.1 hypothetical protein, conserved [Angomonas deanei]|eukprot:EPY20849.1 hypothetical protein AGDE_14444 [Angomonas deanei]
MGNALITFFSIKSEYSRCPNVSTVLMRDARHPARSVAVCPCVAKDSVDSVQTSVNHDDSEAGSVSSTNDRSYIPRSHCYTLPCKQEVEDALSLTGLRDRSSTGHTRKNTTNIESVMGVCELEDNSSSVCNHNSLTDISELEEEEAQEEDDMGPMDCADAEVYYFKNDAHYADMDSIIFRSPPAVCYSSKQLWRAYVYGKGIWHQPRQELVPNTPLVFTSLLHELEAYCGQHYTQSVLAWRSTVKVGRRVNPAGTRPPPRTFITWDPCSS